MSTLSALQTFRQIDANSSGGISLKELTQGQTFGSGGLRQAIQSTSAQQVFNQFDADGNQQLSQNELADGLALVATNTASALLAMQNQQSPVSQLLSGLQVGLYSALNTPQNTSSTAYNVLSAYLKA